MPDWIALSSAVVIPVLAILIPTLLAIWLARRERRDAIAERTEERRQEALDRLLDVLADASLAKEELGGEAPTRRLRRFWNAVARLRLIAGSSDPVLLEWLDAEHSRLAMIAVAATVAADAPTDDPLRLGTKPHLLMYWTIVVNGVQETVVSYETAGRDPSTLHEMLSDARGFTAEPVAHLERLRREADANRASEQQFD